MCLISRTNATNILIFSLYISIQGEYLALHTPSFYNFYSFYRGKLTKINSFFHAFFESCITEA